MRLWGDRPLDILSTYETATTNTSTTTVKTMVPPTRYAVRQVLDQEYHKECLRRQNEARQARYLAGRGDVDADNNRDYYLHNTRGALQNAGYVEGDEENQDMPSEPEKGIKRDFFGRVIPTNSVLSGSSVPLETTVDVDETNEDRQRGGENNKRIKTTTTTKKTMEAVRLEEEKKNKKKVWISYHEGFSNAVRKPVSLAEFLRGL